MTHSWFHIPGSSDFSVLNLPFGIYSTPLKPPRAGIAIGEYIIDLIAFTELGFLARAGVPKIVFDRPVLNDFIRLGKEKTTAVRLEVLKQLTDENSLLKEHADQVMDPMSRSTMHMPVEVGDYTDFYSSMEHARNVGMMFRDPENALLPNWKHLPVGYHGRSSSIILSGTPVRRPRGQVNHGDGPRLQPTAKLDFELEMAFIIGKDSELGTSIPAANAKDYIFGFVLFNDWSARDIQKWEYVPLGPFLGKNFASSMSPWIVTWEALEPFKVDGPAQDPVLNYLKTSGRQHYDVKLEVDLTPQGAPSSKLCTTNLRYMYWNVAQQLAHHTINGCNVCIGDMMASGTISGPSKGSYGSMLELSWGGKDPVKLDGGITRTFLEDFDTVTMRGHAETDGVRVGFGEVSSQILPAQEPI